MMCLGVNFSSLAYYSDSIINFNADDGSVKTFPFECSKGQAYFFYSDVIDYSGVHRIFVGGISDYSFVLNHYVSAQLDNGLYFCSYTNYSNCSIDLSSLDMANTVVVPSEYNSVLLIKEYFETNGLIGLGGGSSSQKTVYDSSIPAPQNLTYVCTNQLSQKLTWTNKLVDSYSVRVSANGRYNDQLTGKPDWHDYNLMLASDGSDGADVGIAASIGGITFSSLDMFEFIGNKYGTESIKAFEPTEFRVQFYAYEDGVMQVGPVGVIKINKNSAGLWVGSTATIEHPVNVDDIGSSGGLYPSGDAWSSAGQDFTDMDKDGNMTGSGVVGDDDSYVPVDKGSTSITDMFTNIINSLYSIPTILTKLFNSLSSMMSGIGAVPAFFGQLFSWLPPEVVSLIGLGLTLVVVLRIFGR